MTINHGFTAGAAAILNGKSAFVLFYHLHV